MKYLIHAVKMLFKSAMQYRSSLLMQVIAQFVMTGGEMLAVECSVMPGSGQVQLTGQLGDVMKESVRAAVSLIRRHADEFSVKDKEFYKNLENITSINLS